MKPTTLRILAVMRKAAVMEHSRKSPTGDRAYTAAATAGLAYGPYC